MIVQVCVRIHARARPRVRDQGVHTMKVIIKIKGKRHQLEKSIYMSIASMAGEGLNKGKYDVKQMLAHREIYVRVLKGERRPIVSISAESSIVRSSLWPPTATTTIECAPVLASAHNPRQFRFVPIAGSILQMPVCISNISTVSKHVCPSLPPATTTRPLQQTSIVHGGDPSVMIPMCFHTLDSYNTRMKVAIRWGVRAGGVCHDLPY